MSLYLVTFICLLSIDSLAALKQSAITKNWAGKYAKRSENQTAMCHLEPVYPPLDKDALEWFDIDLDKNPKDRWTEPMTKFKKEIISFLKLTVESKFLKVLMEFIKKNEGRYLRRLPNNYGEEMQGIATALGRDVSEVFAVNVAYEVMGVCTSIVTQDLNGHIYHARNLDFGLWPAINTTDWQWELTDSLRKVLFNVNFKKGGKTLYQGTVFGTYIGAITGVSQNRFSVTVNSRYDKNYDKYFIKWLLDPFDKSWFLTLKLRSLLEDGTTTFDKAIEEVKGTSFIGPGYVILAGPLRGQGIILTLGPNKKLFNTFTLNHGYPTSRQAPFYVLQTNYDHWDLPPWFDDRRYPALKCMDAIGQKGMGHQTLFNVLSALPSRNRLTTYTALMDPAEGTLKSWKQYCDEPECVPW